MVVKIRRKVIKKKHGDPEWLTSRRKKKQERYDRRNPAKKVVAGYPSLGDLWPGKL